VLFTTYATLRSDAREEKVSRVRQIVDWLGADFDGVIVLRREPCHGERRWWQRRARRPGAFAAGGAPVCACNTRCGCPRALRLRHRRHHGSQSRLRSRLGLWGSEDFPFATRAEFVEAIEAGGVAAMEVLARDLKALALRSAVTLL